MNKYLSDLKWRYATKKFDSTRQIPDAIVEELQESIRLSASSYGLQPYEVFVITDKKVREKLRTHSWGQSQLTDASHIVVFASKAGFDQQLIDSHITNISTTRDIPNQDLKAYGDFMKSKLLDLSLEEKTIWTEKQAYIAVGNLLSAAASLKIDSCPMEGFDADAYNEILGLEEQGLNATVVVALGYRAEDDATQHLKKVRRSKKELFTYI